MGPGDVVADRFEIERVAGSGGMGIVYKAHDRISGAPVAIKVLREAERDERFLREAKILADLNHPRIVKYIAHGQTLAGEAYLAMEWLEGEDLSTRLARSGLDVPESVGLVSRIAEAMAPAHDRGLVHRDIKPRNLFLPSGDLTKVKLLDFGLARSSRQATVITRTGMQVGTPGFMAPEQARGERVDPRADVFSLGCVLFQCLTGRRAFGGDEAMAVLAKLLFEEVPFPSEIRFGIPPELDVLVATMLCKDPKGRPENARAVVERLGALGDLGPTVAERMPMDRPSAESLTTGEKQLLSVILARHVWEARDAEEGSMGAEERASREALRATVARFGGRMEALVDGSVAITLGAARPATDQAAIAARCALAVREHCPDAPVVLATGRGEISGRVPIGEAIDRAARLFAAGDASTDAVRLDALTAGLLDARFDVEQSSSGLRLLGEREPADGARTLLGKPTACVGRDRELATLMAVYEECVSEPVPRVVLVTGEAGVGKSRLRYELNRRVEQAETPAQVWIGRGDPMRAGSPFGLLGEALRRAVGLIDGEPLADRQEKIRARLGRRFTGEDLSRNAEFIGELVGAPFPDDDRVQLRAARENAVLMGDQIRRAWEEWLAAECAAGPLVLILEDLHWGDLPSVGFVDSALRTLKEAPFMVVALARPQVEDAFPKLWSDRAVLPLPLSPLTKKASEKLVRRALGDDVTDETMGRIVERAQGNAFYLEELVRSVAEGR